MGFFFGVAIIFGGGGGGYAKIPDIFGGKQYICRC